MHALGITAATAVAAISLLALQPARVGAVAGFGDVSDDTFYWEPVAWMDSEEITTGSAPGCFAPQDPATRAEAATLLHRLSGSPEPAVSGAGLFDDVVAGSFYDKAVGWLAQEGITTGITATEFGSARPISRAEFATLVWRLAGRPSNARVGADSFVDVVSASFYDHAVGWMADAEITTGVTATTFAPERKVTRAEIATFLWRYVGRPARPSTPRGELCVLSGEIEPSWFTRASVSTSGEQADSFSLNPLLSRDGRYVAFESKATNLVAGDTNGRRDVFVRDLATDTTVRVSVSTSGDQVDDDRFSYGYAISDDGRYTAFTSTATNLVPDDTNDSIDVFLRDTRTETTTRVSVSSAGEEGDDSSTDPVISGDGRYVVFISDASNLVPDDVNGVRDIFRHDTVTGITTRVLASDRSVGGVSTSRDGRWVAFSTLEALVPDDVNAARDVYVLDTIFDAISRVSVSTGGAEADGDSAFADISDDGRRVVFLSDATNLVPFDTNGEEDVFVHDRIVGTTVRANVDSSGGQAEDGGGWPSISGNGRFVSFTARGLPPQPGFTRRQVYVHDLSTRETRVASTSTDGELGRADSTGSSLSHDGRYLAFKSTAQNLVTEDSNQADDIFVRVLPQMAVSAVEPAAVRGAVNTLTVTGTRFVDDATAQIWPPGQWDIVDVRVPNESVIEVDLAVSEHQAPGTFDIYVRLPGSGPGPDTGATAVCRGCLTIA